MDLNEQAKDSFHLYPVWCLGWTNHTGFFLYSKNSFQSLVHIRRIFIVQDLINWIKSCEDLKLEPYLDTTGHLTIGWGRNLRNGIRTDEAELMFKNDLDQAIGELHQQPWFPDLPPGVRGALINMNFNLGITKFLEFKEMIAALEKKDFTTAAQAALNSVWAKEVHGRATDIAVMIREGK